MMDDGKADEASAVQKPEKLSAKVWTQAYSNWWLNQPIWKILAQIGSFPQIGMKIKMFETTT